MSPRVIFTCFAGRERYLKILVPYIKTLTDQGSIHDVHFWDYTRDPSDAKYIRTLPFTILVPNSKENFGDYYKYYTRTKYPDPETVIIKCDDDIVYLDVSRFDEFIKARRANHDALLFSPSIINNPICGAVQLKRGILPGFKPVDFDMTADGGRKIHKYFLKHRKLFMKDSFAVERFSEIPWDMKWRFNINFIAILAKDLDDLYQSPLLVEDDEFYLGIHAPRQFMRCVWIDMHFVAAHMAFTVQRNTGMDETHFMKKYQELKMKDHLT
jgi:hypothetical protein